jgi:leader peptidase (prepilin peptidase) / N-methyltransferase
MATASANNRAAVASVMTPLYPIPRPRRILPQTVKLLPAIFSVLFGLAFGSFLNVCISRLPEGESVVKPRSRCPHCRHSIRGRDNIPLLSWLLLRGRCRDCGAGISIRYPLIELSTAALFLLCFLKFGLSLRGLAGAILCWLLLGLAAMDAEWFLLPDTFTLPGIGLGVLYWAWKGCCGPIGHLQGGGRSLLVAGAGAAVMLLIRWVYWLFRRKEGMGLGDAKLMAMIAAWLGPWMALLVLFLAVVSGAVYGVMVLLSGRMRGKHGAPSEAPRLPFGSFLSGAAIFALFYGVHIINWYMSFMR